MDRVWRFATRCAAWFFLVPLCLFAVIAVLSAAESAYFAMRAERATGSVVELREKKVGDRSALFPVFTFRDASAAEHKVVSSNGSSHPKHQVGDTVPVLYRTDRPDKARIGEYGTLFLHATLTGLVVIVGWTFYSGMGLRRWLRPRRSPVG